MGKILVSGASGNVGRYVVKYALAAGQEVKAAGTDVKRLAKLFPDVAIHVCICLAGCGQGVYYASTASWQSKGSKAFH